MSIHLQGMGVIGCLVACRLKDDGIRFTWSDTDTGMVAWKISTGAIPVFGDQQSEDDRKQWRQWVFKEKTGFAFWMQEYTAKAVWCYTSAKPPHHGENFGVECIAQVGPIKLSNQVSMHIDVQRFVERTRERLSQRRTDVAPRGSMEIVTHGFGDNIHKWSWGWSAVVRADLDKRLVKALAKTKTKLPCLYMRKGMQLPYLYPVGGTGLYYAGTTLITQATPKELAIEPKYDTWFRHVEEYTDGLVGVRQLTEPKQGWRPMADPDAELIERTQTGLRIRPQYGNGIRHFPTTWRALEGML